MIMSDYQTMDKEEIYSKVLRAGRRTYFFDVRATKAGDYYLTITESKKFTNEDGSFHFRSQADNFLCRCVPVQCAVDSTGAERVIQTYERH